MQVILMGTYTCIVSAVNTDEDEVKEDMGLKDPTPLAIMADCAQHISKRCGVCEKSVIADTMTVEELAICVHGHVCDRYLQWKLIYRIA